MRLTHPNQSSLTGDLIDLRIFSLNKEAFNHMLYAAFFIHCNPVFNSWATFTLLQILDCTLFLLLIYSYPLSSTGSLVAMETPHMSITAVLQFSTS